MKKVIKQIIFPAVFSSLIVACGVGISEEEKNKYLNESAEYIGIAYCNCIENETEDKEAEDHTGCAYIMANSIVEVLMDKKLAISEDQDAQDAINQKVLQGLVKTYVEKTCLGIEEVEADGETEVEGTSEAE